MTLLVFGMDGAVREYIEEAIEKGMMPNMEKLIDKGAFGDMKSSVPPITIPAWPSMFSGLHPDTLKVYHMTEMDENYSINSVPSSRWKGKMFWDKLEGKFGLINVPGTSPVWPVNGYMFEGFPMVMDPSTYPEELGEELPEFEFVEKDAQTTQKGRREAMIENFRKRRDIFSEIDEGVDVRVEVYQVTDTVAHRCSNKKQILDVYSEVDEIIGERMEEYDDILLVSDHGFTNVDRYFYINTWLEKNGYLKTTSEESAVDSTVGRMQKLLAPLAETSLRPFLKFFNDILNKKAGVDFSPNSFSTDQIDFSETKAFSFRGGANNHGEININDERYSNGTVEDTERLKDEIKEKLSEAEAVDKVWKREEVYDKPEGMPDLVFCVKEDTGVGVALFSKTIFETNAFIHSDTGIVAAYGESFRNGEIKAAQLADVAPTIAEYVGQGLEVDGNSLDIFREGFNPVEVQKTDEKETADVDF